MSGGVSTGYYRLHVEQNSRDNPILEPGTYLCFRSLLARDNAIQAIKAKYVVKVLFKCPPALDPRRKEPVKAGGGILGRLKTALVRVSHAMKVWFDKLLGRDMTLRVNSPSTGMQDRSLSDPLPVGEEIPQEGRTPLSFRSRSLPDLSHVGEADPQYGRTPLSFRSRSLPDLLPVGEADPQYGRTPRSTSTSPRPVSDPYPKSAREELDLGRDQEAGLLAAEIDFEPNSVQSSASFDSAIQEAGDLYAELEAIARTLAELATEPEHSTVLTDAEPSIAQSNEPRIDKERVSADLLGALVQSYLNNGYSDQWADQVEELVKASEAEDSDRKTL